MDLQKLAALYRRELTQNLLPFWEQYAFDAQYGGVYEALDEKWEVISTDKPIILQAQTVWAFTLAHNHFGPNLEWLQRAQQTARFLLEKGHDAKGNWYQTIDRRGTPLEKATDHFPALYATLALGRLAQATGDNTYAETAQKTLSGLLRKRNSFLKKEKENSGGIPSGGTPPAGRAFKNLKEFALIGHVLLEAEKYSDPKWHQKALDGYVEEMIGDFYDKRSVILLENVTPEGHFWDCPEGRMLVPGRVFEVASFMMDIADRSRNRKLLNQMLDLTELTAQAAWDEVDKGFFYQMDIKSQPSLESRWGHKLAWVHLEALPCLLKAHLLSARPVFLEAFEKTHDYVWAHFPDKTNGAWFQELTREGGPFVRHKLRTETKICSLVRGMAEITRLLEIAAQAKNQTVGSLKKSFLKKAASKKKS